MRRQLPWAALVGCWSVAFSCATAGEELTGEQLYHQFCASCHGTQGQGTAAEYPHELAGAKDLAALSKLIDETMPQGEAEALDAGQSAKVAEYVFENFYSTDARAKNPAPRLELSRLTVRQYRNTLADLLGSFHEPLKWGEERGLRAEYFKGKDFRRNERAMERVDREVKFDFGTASPEPEKMDARNFSIRWEGSVLAPETGEYEIVVRTDHAARLWLNDPRKPLIDAWVKSGNETEFRASIFLLGGRPYPLKLEFTKAHHGGKDTKDEVEPPVPPAFVELAWRAPGAATELIPSGWLSTDSNPVTYVSEAAFPPDDRSVGYERGSSISRAWFDASTEGAMEASQYVATRARELTGVKDDASAEEKSKGYREFARKFVERAFRRGPADGTADRIVEAVFGRTQDAELSLRRVVLLATESPRFLYRESASGDDRYDRASRLSYTLWDSMPDDELWKAAAEGRLETVEDVRNQARRMVDDPRARSKVRDFLLQWLKVDQAPELAKNAEHFPGFDASLSTDLRASLELFLDDVVWSETSDYRQLMLADEVYLNGRLAKFYGVDLAEDAEFQKVKMDDGQRAGILSHPYLMSVFGYTDASSPIHRGVFLARNVMGRVIRPPTTAFAPLSPDLHPDLTTRERTIKQTGDPACQTCHAMINSLGFSLERFDAVGRLRSDEHGKPVDDQGGYQTVAGDDLELKGVRGLAEMVAASDEAHAAFVQRFFQYLVKQPLRGYGPYAADELQTEFAGHEYSIRALMVEIATKAATVPAAPETTTAGAGFPGGPSGVN